MGVVVDPNGAEIYICVIRCMIKNKSAARHMAPGEFIFAAANP